MDFHRTGEILRGIFCVPKSDTVTQRVWRPDTSLGSEETVEDEAHSSTKETVEGEAHGELWGQPLARPGGFQRLGHWNQCHQLSSTF